MPTEVGPWKHAEVVEIIKPIVLSPYVRTTDLPPQVGDQALIIHVNTANGEPSSVAIMCEDRSWVVDVECLRLV